MKSLLSAVTLVLVGLNLYARTVLGGTPVQPPGLPPAATLTNAVNQPYTGWVTDVTKDSITIREYGPPRRFAVSEVLAAGGYPKDETPCCSYKLSQVQVGDSVGISFDRTNGVEVCMSIGIRRRPGGKVPPGNYRPGLVMPHPPHEFAQAYQDFEEKGVPIPPWLRMPFEDLPVAPKPREVKAPAPPTKETKEVLRFYPKTHPLPDVIIGSTEFMWEYRGQVTAVDQFSITIRARGEEPKRFPAAGALAGQPPLEPPCSRGTHSLTEVRVGDLVYIIYYTSARRGLLEACLKIHIMRRPGGTIPPLSSSIHVRYQAYQDWEEKGTPIPDEFLPVSEKVLGVPYPPVAPEPREAKPKPKA